MPITNNILPHNAGHLPDIQNSKPPDKQRDIKVVKWVFFLSEKNILTPDEKNKIKIVMNSVVIITLIFIIFISHDLELHSSYSIQLIVKSVLWMDF